MRISALLVLLLATSLLIPAARADEDDGLPAGVSVLLDELADMKAEIQALKARVADLEKALAEREARDDVPPEAPPTPKAPAEAGTYQLDGERSADTILDGMPEAAPVEGETTEETAARRATLRAEIASEFEGLEMSVTLLADGTFTAWLRGLPGEESAEHLARGLWTSTRDAEKNVVRVTLETTHEDGQELERQITIHGEWTSDGALRLQEQDSEFVMVFVRG